MTTFDSFQLKSTLCMSRLVGLLIGGWAIITRRSVMESFFDNSVSSRRINGTSMRWRTVSTKYCCFSASASGSSEKV